jgi:hypothetical protein
MWTLFIISMSPYMDEPKVTRYEEYTSQWNCNISIVELEEEFKNGEVAICIQTGKVIPDVDVLY